MEFSCTNQTEEELVGTLPSNQTGPTEVLGDTDNKLSAAEEATHEAKAEAELPVRVETGTPEIHTVGGKVADGYKTPGSEKPQRPVKFVESPDWLPKGWITEVRTREGGSSAGNKDKYFFDPVSKRRFRSRKEVFSFLETGKLGRYKPRPKFKPEGHIGLETKTAPKRAAKLQKLHSNTSEIAEVLPSTAPNAVVLSSSSCLLPFSITPGSELLIYDKTTLPCQTCPMLGFIYQSGAVVSSTSIKTQSPLSHLHGSVASQSTSTSDVSKRPSKVRWVLNGSEGSWVPLISEEKATESCKKEGERILDLNGNDADTCKGLSLLAAGINRLAKIFLCSDFSSIFWDTLLSAWS